jgi:hypothetical protein
MFTRFSPRSTLDRAIALSVAAMLAFNVLVLSQQLQSAPDFASHGEPTVQQA